MITICFQIHFKTNPQLEKNFRTEKLNFKLKGLKIIS
jgi:hypothetical protein